ncbi:MAG: signal peptidase I [Clostridiaceae bacterium]
MKGLKVIKDIIAMILILVFIAIAGISFFSAPKDKGLFGIKGYVVVSGSMESEILPGDFIFVKTGSYTNIKEKDIITFIRNEEIVTHRAIDITKEGITTKGDANNVQDESKVQSEDYIGTYLIRLPYFGYFIVWLQKPLVFISICILLAGYLISIYIIDAKREKKEETM